MIEGGYYIKARCIQNSEIAIMPPYIREMWDWLLKEANHTSNKINELVIERGQLVRTFKDIQEGLYWMIGWRKMTYKKWQCENAMKFLRERAMITTKKTTRGMLITICNYDYYQDSKNYESNRRTDTRTTVNKQTTDTINKNDKNDKNDKNIYSNAKLVLFYLNEKCNRKFTNPNQITARLKEGKSVEDCKKIIDIKLHDPYFIDNPHYISPATLFRKSHWDTYINQKIEDFKKDTLKGGNENYIAEIYPELKTVKINKDEYDKLVEKFGIENTKSKIEDVFYHIGKFGDKYKSHYLTILSWERKNEREKKQDTQEPESKISYHR